MTRTKFISIMLTLLLTASAAIAQKTETAAVSSVREIPLEGIGLQMEVAPNGQVAAVFENYIILGNTVDPALLPIRLVDLATGEVLRYLAGQTDYTIDAAFSPDSSKLVSYHGNGYIFVWDVATGEMIRQISSFMGSGRIEFLSDGHRIAVLHAGTLANILLWNIETGYIEAVFNQHLTLERVFNAEGLFDSYISLAVSPDNRSIITTTAYGRIQLIQIASGRDLTLHVTDSEQPRFNIRAVSFVPDSSGLIYHDSETNSLHIINAASGAELFTIPTSGGSPALAVSPDGSRVAWAARGDTGISIADLQPNAEVTLIPMPERFADFAPPTNSIAFTPDGSQLIVGGLSAPDDDQNAIFVVDIPE